MALRLVRMLQIKSGLFSMVQRKKLGSRLPPSVDQNCSTLGRGRGKVSKSAMKVPAILTVAFLCLSDHLVAVDLCLFSRAPIISFSFCLYVCIFMFQSERKSTWSFLAYNLAPCCF